MPHVGVERLAAGDHQEDRAERDISDGAAVDHETHGVPRIEREEDTGQTPNLDQPEHAEDPEPEQHDRAEDRADAGGASLLEREQQQQNDHRDWQHEFVDAVRRGLQPFDRAQHRDRWRDHAVAVEQRRAEQAERDQHLPLGAAFALPWIEQRQQRQNAALAPVVGAHDQRQIFDRHDDHQRPEDQREYAEHVFRRRRQLDERLAERVERARADIAVDHAQHAEAQSQQAVVALCGTVTRPRRPTVRGPGRRRRRRDGGRLRCLLRFIHWRSGPVTEGSTPSLWTDSSVKSPQGPAKNSIAHDAPASRGRRARRDADASGRAAARTSPPGTGSS